MTDRLTACEQLLLAASSFQGPFALTDLIVAAWERDKDFWGLRGREEDFPDSNKVHVLMARNHGPLRLGLMYPPPRHYVLGGRGTRMYALTTAGLAKVAEIRAALNGIPGGVA